MRIGLVIYGSLETISGGYLYDRKLVEYLRAQGDEVEIIALPWRNYFLHILDNFSPAFHQRLLNLEVDVLLEDELNHPSLFWLNKRIRGRISFPIVAIVHHLRSSEQHSRWVMWLYRQVERHYLNDLDGIIYNSRTTREAVEDIVDIHWDTIVAYPAGDHIRPQISVEKVVERAKREGPLQILFIGNVIARKGLHILIKALRVSELTFHLSMVGRMNVDVGYVRSIQRQIKDAKLEDRVTFHGALVQAALDKILEESQVLVVPSSYEGFGIVYLEGMGYGLPAIGSCGGGAKEIITHGQNGYLIEPEDAMGLAEHLHELHKNRELLVQMSLAARQRYESQPGWKHTGESIRQFLISLRKA